MPLPHIPKFFDTIEVDSKGCWNWLGSLVDGYGQIKSGRTSFKVHRLSWILYRGEIPKGMNVLHTCDNRKCINPSHLFIGTILDNSIDAAKKCRLRNGFPLCDVPKIRALNRIGLKQTHIARLLGVSQGHVSKIVNKKRRQYI